MKIKSIFSAGCAMAIIATSAVSCGGSANGLDEYNDSASRSLTLAAGKASGIQFNLDCQAYLQSVSEAERAQFNKDDYMRGVMYALQADTTNRSFIDGYFAGVSLLSFALNQNSSDKIDLKLLYESVGDAFRLDSITESDLIVAQQAFMDEMDVLRKRAIEARLEALASTPEALANIQAGDDFVGQAKLADSSIVTAESGLSYKVENPGTGAKLTEDDLVKLRYEARTVEGVVFDYDSIGGVFPVYNFPQGFIEGLSLLGEGGKATFYIPGKIAYGADGIPQIGIGPFEMVVYDVEILEVNPPANYK